MDYILAVQKELGSVVGLPEDMQYVKNAMTILKEARTHRAALEKVAEQMQELLKSLSLMNEAADGEGSGIWNINGITQNNIDALREEYAALTA